jgi:hypothetical protein
MRKKASLDVAAEWRSSDNKPFGEVHHGVGVKTTSYIEDYPYNLRMRP